MAERSRCKLRKSGQMVADHSICGRRNQVVVKSGCFWGLEGNKEFASLKKREKNQPRVSNLKDVISFKNVCFPHPLKTNQPQEASTRNAITPKQHLTTTPPALLSADPSLTSRLLLHILQTPPCISRQRPTIRANPHPPPPERPQQQNAMAMAIGASLGQKR